jgi:uncharacterized cupin superfamily protein
MNKLSIIHLEPNGPDNIGLVPDELDPADFQSPLPLQNTYAYYDDENTGLYVGVWDTDTMQELFQPYAMDEFMWVLEGQVAMVDENDDETIVKQGEAFVIPKGYPCSWKQKGYLKKFYMIYDNPDEILPETPAASKIIIPREDAPLEEKGTYNPFVFKGEKPTQKSHTCYRDTTGQMSVGTFESTPFESEPLPFPCNEMAYVIEGSITITDDKGLGHLFKKGDAFFIPKGVVCHWQTETIRLFYSIFQPKE